MDQETKSSDKLSVSDSAILIISPPISRPVLATGCHEQPSCMKFVAREGSFKIAGLSRELAETHEYPFPAEETGHRRREL